MHHPAWSRRRTWRLARTAAVLAALTWLGLLLIGRADSGAVPAAVASADPTVAAPVRTPTAVPPTTDLPTGSPAEAPDGPTPGPASVPGGPLPPPTSPWTGPTPIGINDPVPGTTNLQPVMAAAYESAVAAAAGEGVRLPIRSGWRSAQFQQILFDRAVRRYGSATEAARWVKPPEQSAHVQGLAVDIDSRAGARWLDAHGHEHGLCRVYENEWWHFEYHPGPCPALLADASG